MISEFIVGDEVMEYITASQASKKWGISQRRVQILCAEGRIPGVASFICNVEGNVIEKDINPKDDVKLILRECKEISTDEDVNVVSRIAFLRKLCELNECRDAWEYAYEILSCLVHARPIKRKNANNVYEDMSTEEIEEGLNKIKEFIPDFVYDDLLENIYTVDHIKELYNLETNAYLKIQLFRALKNIVDENQFSLKPMDSARYKFIDETYHIENDYLHYLDVMKFNIVPDYIRKKVDEIMSEL